MNQLIKLLIITLLGFSAQEICAQVKKEIISDSTNHKADSIDIENGKTPEEMAYLFAKFNPEKKVISRIISPGRRFTKQWFDANGYSAFPVNKYYNSDELLDPYSMPLDLSLLPSDEHRMDINGGELNIITDSVKYRQPYTNLHYQFGSYAYKNLFVRHHQTLGRWTIDLHGQNSSGEDGHPFSSGTKANISGRISYMDGKNTSIELEYEAWRLHYRYNPYYPDSSIVRQAGDKVLTDRWTLKRVWVKNEIERTEAGIRYASREGHWVPATMPEQNFDYRTYGGYLEINRIFLGNPLFLRTDLNFYEGKTRKGEIDDPDYSFFLNGDYFFGNKMLYMGKISFSGGVLPGLTYGKIIAQINLKEFLFLKGGTGLTPRYDEYGVYKKQSFNNTWADARFRILTGKNMDVFAGVGSSYFNGIRWIEIAQNKDTQLSNQLSISANYHVSNLQINIKFVNKITGFEQIPDQQAELGGKFKFRLISHLYIDSYLLFRYAHNYKQFEFDLDKYLLKNGFSTIENSLQLDLKITAKIEDLEIYYQGIHLDAFIVDDYDFAPIKGFAHDLPRFRIGVRWILFN